MNIELSHTLILDLHIQVSIWEGPELQYGFSFFVQRSVIDCIIKLWVI